VSALLVVLDPGALQALQAIMNWAGRRAEEQIGQGRGLVADLAGDGDLHGKE
jgi:hypothetical protein